MARPRVRVGRPRAIRRPDVPPVGHDGAEPRRGTRAAFAWLLLLGAAAIFVGGHDMVAGAEITVRLWGTLVLSAGALLVAGGLGLESGREQGRALALVAALVGAGLGALTLLAQIINDRPDGRVLAWAAIVAGSAAAALRVHSATPAGEREKGLWRRLPLLNSIVSVGVLAGIAQFWYASIFIPTTAPVSLTVEPRLEHVRERDHGILRGTVTVQNRSSSRVSVLGSTLHLTADTLASTRLDDIEFRSEVRRAQRGEIISASRYTGFSAPTTTVSYGRLFPDGTYVEPGETITEPFLARIPRDAFNVAGVEAWLAIARGNALPVESVEPVFADTKDGTTVTTPIPETGWLRRLTRGERSVRVDYDEDVAVYPTVTIRRGDDATVDDGFDARMWRLYGVNMAVASAVIPVSR